MIDREADMFCFANVQELLLLSWMLLLLLPLSLLLLLLLQGVVAAIDVASLC